jgi:hypothetical protein
MDLQRLAGWLLILSFVFLAAGAMAAPPLAYRGPDIPSRLRVIQENQGRWILSKVFDGLAIFTPAVAMLVLMLALREQQPVLPLALATIGFWVSGLVGLVVVYRLAFDPEASFTTSLPPILDIPGSLGLTIGMLFVGWAYLQGAFPTWIGYLSIAAGILSLGAYFFIGFSLAFYVAAILYIINTVIGVVIIRASG